MKREKKNPLYDEINNCNIDFTNDGGMYKLVKILENKNELIYLDIYILIENLDLNKPADAILY